MAPVSVLPGRIRLESARLVGNEGLCRLVELEFGGVRGVLEVTANRRTGRVLVRYDEQRLDEAAFAERMHSLRDAAGTVAVPEVPSREGHRGAVTAEDVASWPAGRVVVDLLIQSLLPRPLDFLVPAALAVFRK